MAVDVRVIQRQNPLSGLAEGFVQGQTLRGQRTKSNLENQALQRKIDAFGQPLPPGFVMLPDGTVKQDPTLPKPPTQVNVGGIGDVLETIQSLNRGDLGGSGIPQAQGGFQQPTGQDFTGTQAPQGSGEGEIIDDVDDATGQVIASYQVVNGSLQRVQ